MQEPIVLKKSKFGKGVFSTKNIKAEEKICTIKGEKINSADLSRVAETGRNVLVDPLQIGQDEFLIVESPCLYLNHSCEPNSGIRNAVELFAIKPIKEGEEIVFDYSTTWLEGFSCECGSENCRKHVGDYFTIPKAQRNKYKKINVVPKFILQADIEN
ncbi:MAG: SET domain-containing protein [bacterium]|nr:SET domain-containing protein [bacterium]